MRLLPSPRSRLLPAYLLYSKVLATCQLKRKEAKKKYLGQIDDLYAEASRPPLQALGW